jgi:threonine dehydrogenase-like Zn-dependent dehydrogenase
MIPDRLAVASAMGASQALIPGKTDFQGPFDVSIEVSGNGRALQSAIDHTRNGGRIIVGSWYGNTDVSLKLGIDFHRSHKTIQTSQVSEIPAKLSTLWTKQRRFGLAWELVKQIRPSRLLTKVVRLDQAQEAYDALDRGSEIAVAFDHNY